MGFSNEIDKVNADLHRGADTTKAVAEAIDEVTAKLRGEVEEMEKRQEKKVEAAAGQKVEGEEAKTAESAPTPSAQNAE